MHQRKQSAILLFAIAIIAILVLPIAGADECYDDAQCGGCSHCDGGYCDSGCPENFSCQNGIQCIKDVVGTPTIIPKTPTPTPEPEYGCKYDWQCEECEECGADGHCNEIPNCCVRDRDCPRNYVCESHNCVQSTGETTPSPTPVPEHECEHDWQCGECKECGADGYCNKITNCCSPSCAANYVCQGNTCVPATVQTTPTPEPKTPTPPGGNQACTPAWACISSFFRALQKTDCTFEPEQYCSGGCLNGECQQACKSCTADFSGQCGSFENGCGKTIPCGCDSGYNCVGGKCCRQVSCKAGECGSKSNECGQNIQCGSCETGFECNAFNQCVLKQTPKELEISNVQAFPYSTYAIITWQTSIEADSKAEFGETESLGSSESDWATTTEHYILVYGLKPETKYFFKVSSSAGQARKESEIKSFNTTPWKDEPLKILQILVSPESKTQFEGQAFSFTAITNSQKPVGLKFFWDFGDDSNGTWERAFHSYYGLGITKEKEFTVRVIAKDSNGLTAGSEIKVKVLKSKFKAIVLEPKQYKRHSKEADLNVKIEFLDEKDQAIECGKIRARVLLAGKIIEMQCTDGNLFSGTFAPWPSLSGMELMEISADYNAKVEKQHFNTRVPVYFQPVFLEATEAFKGKKYFLNDSLENAKIRFLLDGIFLVFPDELRASLVSGAKEEEVKIERQEYEYEIYFDRSVEESDITEGLKLRLEGSDKTGNLVDAVQEVPIVKDNPALTLVVLEPAEGKRTYSFGQSLKIRAKILSNNYGVQGKQLFLECAELDLTKELEFDSSRQEFSTEIMLPERGSGLKKIELKLTASGLLEGKEIRDFEFVEIMLSDILKPEFVLPSQGTTKIFSGELKEIKVRFLQPNGMLFTERELEAELKVDGNPQTVLLEFNDGEKLHKAVLDAPIPLGEHGIELALKGEFEGETVINSRIEQDAFGGIAAFFAAAFVLAFLALIARNALADRGFLLQEKERLSGIEKKYKFEYFKRHVSEGEFNAKTTRIRQAEESVSALLKSRYWLFSGLLKTFCWKKDLKKCPSAVQTASLAVRLAGKTNYFSRQEMARAIIAEGHSEKVAGKVLEKIYGK